MNSYKQIDAATNIYIIEEGHGRNIKCSIHTAAVLQETVTCSPGSSVAHAATDKDKCFMYL